MSHNTTVSLPTTMAEFRHSMSNPEATGYEIRHRRCGSGLILNPHPTDFPMSQVTCTGCEVRRRWTVAELKALPVRSISDLFETVIPVDTAENVVKIVQQPGTGYLSSQQMSYKEMADYNIRAFEYRRKQNFRF